jgi:DNA-binding CsgD family transcriptional regulator
MTSSLRRTIIAALLSRVGDALPKSMGGGAGWLPSRSREVPTGRATVWAKLIGVIRYLDLINAFVTMRRMETWPLVGREAELGRIAVAMDSQASPGITGIVLAGPPGVGKTRLARKALRQARERGAIVEWVVATEAAATIPFGPLAHLLPRARGTPSTLLDLLRETAEDLAERTAGDQLVLGVDDAHLLDGPSATLVHHLALTGVASLLLTLRVDAAPPDAITGLWKDGLVERLDVRPFSPLELEQLLAVAVGGHVDGATVRQFWELSRGNALFLRELVAGALQEGTLAPAGGMWRARGPLGRSTRLAEVIQALPDKRRLQVRLAHPVYGEVLRATVPPLRKRAICRQLADALARAGARRHGDPLRLAVWRMDGGAVAEPELLTEAARLAGKTFFDHALAERLALAAVDAGGGIRARRVLAETLFAQGRSEEAATLLAAMQHAATGADRAHLAVLRAHTLFLGLGRALEAERVIADADRLLAASSWGEEGRILRATIAFSRGRTRAALDDVAPLLQEAAAEPTGLRALTLATGALAFSGHAERAAAAAEAALAGSARTGKAPSLASDRLRAALCVAYRLAGRLHEADLLAREGYQAALDQRARELQGPWALLRGENALARGEVEVAVNWLREAAHLLRERGWFFGVYSKAWCLGSLAEASALLGDLDGAAAAVAEADAATAEQFFVPNRERGRVWLAAACGEISAARELATHAAQTAADLGSHMVEAIGLHDVARLALAAGDGSRLDASSAEFEEIGALLLAAEAAAEAARAYDPDRRATSVLVASRRSRTPLHERPVRTPALDLPDKAIPLTLREREIAVLVAQGLSNREIAGRLVVSVRTVDSHLQRVFTKLHIGRREELAALFERDPDDHEQGPRPR